MRKCWDGNPDKRPDMDEVVRLLEAIDTSKGGGMIPEDQVSSCCFFSVARGPWYILYALFESFMGLKKEIMKQYEVVFIALLLMKLRLIFPPRKIPIAHSELSKPFMKFYSSIWILIEFCGYQTWKYVYLTQHLRLLWMIDDFVYI